MKRQVIPLFALLLVGALLAACGPSPTPAVPPEPTTSAPTPKPTEGSKPTTGVPTPMPTGSGTVHGQAQVDDVDVLILESFPVQVRVIARGYLPDGCTSIDTIAKERNGQEFRVVITTARPAGLVCTQALVPFEENISLDVLGLPAGTYTVNVNGVARSFELAVDNTLPTEPATGTSTYTAFEGWSFDYPASWDRLENGFVQESATGKTVTFHAQSTSQAELEAWIDAEIARKLAATEAENSLAEPLSVEQRGGMTVYRYAILSKGDGSETLLRTTVFFDGSRRGSRRYEFYAAIPPVAEAEYQAIVDSFRPAPGDGPVLTWHRQGGIAGFCDDLIVYASGDAYGQSCKGSQSEIRHLRLTAQQLEQVSAWTDRFQSFEIEQTDPATADAMTIRLTFSGTGTAVAGEAEKQAILDLATALYAEMPN